MKTRFLFLLCLVMMTLSTFAQSMTDDQVLQYVATESSKGTSQQKMVTNLMKKGVSVEQLQRVRRKAEDMQRRSTSPKLKDNATRTRTSNSENDATKMEESLSVIAESSIGREELDSLDSDLLQDKEGRKVFGRNIFNTENLTFQPASNMATPQNYTLGAGDVVNIDIWGASQQSLTETISPDGTIIIEGVGPVNIGGKTVSQANNSLKARLGQFYSDCQFNLTLGETRTIQVQVIGEVKIPGTYSLNSLCSAFNALYAAGGISEIGTLRNIKLYRRGKQISTIDVYDYLVNGNSAGDVRLQDNDVIVVGPYECLVEVQGKAKRPMWYEMKESETVKNLLRYCGGFTGDAYTQKVRVTRKAGMEYSIHTVEEFQMSAFTMKDEDVVEIDSVRPRFSNMIEILGAVKHPGKYQLGGNIVTVRELLLAADGLKEDAYQERAVMHREKEDLTLEMVSVDVKGILDGTTADIPLKNNDVLFVPSKSEMIGERKLEISGEVAYPGVYPFADNTTLRDIILQAGGINESGSFAKIDVFRRVRDNNSAKAGNISAQTFSFTLDETYNITRDTTFFLSPFDIVIVHKSPSYEEQQEVTVIGQVNFQGKYFLLNKDYRLSDLIKACGGVTDKAYVKGAHLTRVMTKVEIEQRDHANQQAQIALYESALKAGAEVNMQIADSLLAMKQNTAYTFPVAIDLDKAIKNPGSDYDLILRKDDLLEIPEQSNIIKVSGEIMFPVSMAYQKGKNMTYYINHAGGFSSNAKRSKVYGVNASGSVVRLHSNSVRDIQPGMEIVVPQKSVKKKLSSAEIIGMASGVASVGAIIVSLMNVLKN